VAPSVVFNPLRSLKSCSLVGVAVTSSGAPDPFASLGLCVFLSRLAGAHRALTASPRSLPFNAPAGASPGAFRQHLSPLCSYSDAPCNRPVFNLSTQTRPRSCPDKFRAGIAHDGLEGLLDAVTALRPTQSW